MWWCVVAEGAGLSTCSFGSSANDNMLRAWSGGYSQCLLDTGQNPIRYILLVTKILLSWLSAWAELSPIVFLTATQHIWKVCWARRASTTHQRCSPCRAHQQTSGAAAYTAAPASCICLLCSMTTINAQVVSGVPWASDQGLHMRVNTTAA
jgi:hypothetical protein